MKHNELIERLERESGAGWTDGHFGWLADAAVALRELQAERDKYRESLLSKHGRESLIGMALLGELDEGRAERDALDKHLGELLAVIHRDGGQYREERGDEKATEDAIVRVQQERLTFRDLLAVADACIQTPGQAWEYNATLEAARELRTALAGREAG